MTILDKIVKDKHKEIALKREHIPTLVLEQAPFFERKTIALANKLQQSQSGIIAEFKRRSPSKSVINQTATVEDVAIGYENAGVCGMSILTDEIYFGGTLDDLITARQNCNLPLLRKDFVIDEYQIIEAKAFGADVILLIASILSREEIQQLSELAKSLKLEVLLEIHNEEELHKSLMPTIDMIGVNNRNLKTFEVNLDASKYLSEFIPNEFVKVSESGISNIESIKELKQYGYQGFLIGEHFMKTDNPGAEAKMFIKSLL